MADEYVFGQSAVSMEESVRKDLARLPPEMREGGMAQVALYCAVQLDEGGMSPRDAAGFLQQLRMALATLREMAPGEVKGDVTDEVRERRERRLRGQEA